MKKPSVTDRDFDILLALGASEYAKQLENENSTDGAENLVVSERFKKNMNKIIDQHSRKERLKKKNTTLRQIAASIAIVISLGVIGSISVNAFGGRDFFIAVFDQYFTFGHSGTHADTPDVNLAIKMNHTDIYLPEWLPDGFEYQELFEGDQFYVISYVNEQQIIRFTQRKCSLLMESDSELVGYKKINEDKTTYYYLEKNYEGFDSIKLVWMQDDHQLSLEASLDKDTMLMIARSIEHYSEKN